MQSQQANLVYGFGWVLFDAFLGFAGLLIIKLALRGFNRAGVPPIMFLISGLIPWMMFQHTYGETEVAVKRGKNLLLIPRITELDLVLATAVRIFGTYLVLFVVLAFCDSFYEQVPFPRFPMGIILLFVSMSLMGISRVRSDELLTRLYPAASKFTSFSCGFR